MFKPKRNTCSDYTSSVSLASVLFGVDQQMFLVVLEGSKATTQSFTQAFKPNGCSRLGKHMAEHSGDWAGILASGSHDQTRDNSEGGWACALADQGTPPVEPGNLQGAVLSGAGLLPQTQEEAAVSVGDALLLPDQLHNRRDLAFIRPKAKGRPAKRARFVHAVPYAADSVQEELPVSNVSAGPMGWFKTLEQAGLYSDMDGTKGLQMQVERLKEGTHEVANMSPGAFAVPLLKCLAMSSAETGDAKEYTALQQHFIENPDYHNSSLTVVALQLGVQRSLLQEKLCRLAAGHM
eukprot:3319331-Amphidinium_carterae.1